METNQSMLDRAGMRMKRRDAAPPEKPSRWGDTSATPSRAQITPSCAAAAKRALQTEANERQRAKDYQDALIYSQSDYQDRPKWVAPPPALLPPASKREATPSRVAMAKNIAASTQRAAGMTRKQLIQARLEKKRNPKLIGSQVEHPHFTLIRGKPSA